MKKKKTIIISILSVIVLTYSIFFYYTKMKYVYRNTFATNIRDKFKPWQTTEVVSSEIKNRTKKPIEYLQKDTKDINIPILMYHAISDTNPLNDLLTPPDKFREQIKWLYENGFTPLLIDDVLEAFKTVKVPKRPVAITFDDGYADNYTEAYKILKEFNMKGTFFVITDYINKDNTYMTLNMLKEMKNNGMAIENHTSDHLRLNWRSKEEKIKSIKNAQNFLRDNLGIHSKYLCYPVGRYNKETIEVAKSLGVRAAVTTKNGISSIEDGEFSLKRVRMSPMSIKSFKKIFENYMQ